MVIQDNYTHHHLQTEQASVLVLKPSQIAPEREGGREGGREEGGGREGGEGRGRKEGGRKRGGEGGGRGKER